MTEGPKNRAALAPGARYDSTTERGRPRPRVSSTGSTRAGASALLILWFENRRCLGAAFNALRTFNSGITRLFHFRLPAARPLAYDSGSMADAWRRLYLLALFAVGPQLYAASPAEETTFAAAYSSFSEMIWDRAEAEFASFARTFTNSARLPEAILYQAEARFKQTNFVGVIDLLSTQQTRAGKFADEYLFWTGEAYLRKGDFRQATETFARLTKEFPESTRRLEATVEQAAAHAQLQQWSQVVGLLERTNSVFQRTLTVAAPNDHIVNGYLILAKAHLAKGENSAAGQVLARLGKLPLSAANDWQRLYLLCRVYLAESRPEEALLNTTNLLTLAINAGQPKLRAESIALKAGVLERLGRLSDAIAAYTNNLAEGTPLDRHREALLKVVQLSLKQNSIPEAAQTLERYLHQYTNAPAEDLAWLTLGELRLRQCAAGAETNLVSNSAPNDGTTTNCLDQALTALKTFSSRFPESAYAGRAQLDLGWCFWLAGEIPESQAAFQAAVQRLPASVDQATAYFKLADVQSRQTNFLGAISNYSAVVERFSNLPQVETNLVETALYRMVRAGLAADDMAAASNAMAKILIQFPNGFYADRAVLLTAQAIGGRNPALARHIFSDFAQRWPGSPLLPELKLALARTYEEENRWPEAIVEYDHWLTSFTNHSLQAQVEYSLAWANGRAQRETNALTLFTNFLARFQTAPGAPFAQWWVADYYRHQGDLTEAEKNYQWCYQNTNWPAGSELAYQAMMMAGRCAIGRKGWTEAKDYFLRLINDAKCPPDLQAQAWCAFGAALMSQVSLGSTNKAPDYGEAITAFDKILILFPTNPIAVDALGEKASCLLQISQNSQDLALVTNAFQKVIATPMANARARSIAKVGLAITLEKLADQRAGSDRNQLLIAARDQYLDVLNGRMLRDGETPDPFWTKEAGLKVARLLADVLKQPGQAIKTLEQLQKMFPVLRLEDKINALRAQDQEMQHQSL